MRLQGFNFMSNYQQYLSDNIILMKMYQENDFNSKSILFQTTPLIL